MAGNWRGSFGHKNGAAAIMAILLFLGVYFIRAGGWITGIAVIGLSLLFLLYAGGKSALALCFVVLLLTSLCQVIRSFWLRAVMLLTPLVLLNMLGLGTVMSDTLAEIAKLLPLDTSFTGRTDIWTFAIQSLQPRLATGYGFAAFWGSSAIQDLPEGKEWAAFASHSHNGYLDTALGMGLPGLALLIVAIVDQAAARFSCCGPRRQWRPAGNLVPAHLAVRALSVVDGKFFPRSRRTDVVHRPGGGVRPALHGAVSRQGVTLRAAPARPRRHPSTSHRNRREWRPAAGSPRQRSGRHRLRCPSHARPAQ